MDVQTVTQLISNVGFPIAVCVYMAWDRYKTQREMTQALDNNTIALQQILEHIRKEDNPSGK